MGILYPSTIHTGFHTKAERGKPANIWRNDMANHLSQEKSPYLLQHKDNPVNWYPWGKAAFQKAAKEDKPVFLSVGYSTCHWCHVMAQESFEDEEVAALLNEGFVSIKVDREERPDVDAVYMAACQALTGAGGWPLTVFLTPEQKPFFAGTYFPKRARYGQSGLIELLRQVRRLWDTNREKLLETGDQLTKIIAQKETAARDEPDRRLLYGAYRQLQQCFDPVWGGFGAAPKFPTPHNLLFLMRFSQWEEKPKALQMAETALQSMARGGIFDQIGGGFSRYSTDEKWLVPHFEKMLYDNALLIMAYLTAFRHTQKEVYADAARRTAEYVLRDLSGPTGAFCCGEDADSDGVEGKYYVFTPREILSVLGSKDGEEFCRLYNITENGNFERSSIPNRIGKREKGWEQDDARIKQLYAYRKGRTGLHRDDKILLSWNAWTVTALAQAGFLLKEPRYMDAAVQTQRFIEENMTDQNNRLFLRYRDGEAAHTGQLEDYAVYALSLLELYRLTLEVSYLKQAIYRAKQMIDFFEDRENGGYFINAADAEQLIARPKETYDGAIPSGNSVAAMVLERLAGLTAETFWRDAADRQRCFLAGQAALYPAGHCFALLAMSQTLYPHKELICAGKSIPDEWKEYIRRHLDDNLSILFLSKENALALSEAAPFTKAYPVPEQGNVWYLCENGSCHAPVASFEELELS